MTTTRNTTRKTAKTTKTTRAKTTTNGSLDLLGVARAVVGDTRTDRLDKIGAAHFASCLVVINSPMWYFVVGAIVAVVLTTISLRDPAESKVATLVSAVLLVAAWPFALLHIAFLVALSVIVPNRKDSDGDGQV